jgi:PAS domain S-box-containing protein
MIRVLYVDDESNILELCKIFLERSGDFTVTIATSAPEAIRILGQKRFDAIVSDYQMPEMDGIEFLKHLKDKGNTTPVIIFTGKGREEVVIDALNAGAAFYLQKGGGAKSQFAELSHKIKKAVESRQVEEALRRNETRLRGYFNLPLHGIAITSPDKRWLEVNDRICSMLGYTRDELFHKNWAELTHPDDLAADEEQFNRILSGQIEQYTMDKRFIRKDGGVIWTNITIGCVRKSDGNVDYILGLMEDITERKQTEDALRESEERFRKQYQNNPLAIFTWQHREGDFILVDCNKAAQILTSGRSNDFIGKTASEMYATRPEIISEIRQAFSERTGLSKELVSENFLPGRLVNTTAAYVPPDLIMVHMEDITERRHAEEALKISEERYRAVVEDQTEFICRFTPDGRLTFVNDAYCRYFGLDRSRCLGNSHTVKLTPEDARMMKYHLASLTPQNPVTSIEHRIIMPSGEIRWQRWNDRAIFDKTGQVVEYQSVGRDITDIKRAEEALMESETRYREFFTISRDSIFISSPEGRWIDFNDALVEMFGFESRKEMFEVPVQSIYADPKERSAFTQRIERDGYVKEYPVQLKQKGGTVIDTIITTVPVRNPDGSTKAFIGTIRDVTKQKRAEQETRTLQQFQQSIIDNANVWISVLDPKGSILVWNNTAEQISGYLANDVIGKNTIWKQLYPDPVYRKQVAENILNIINKNTYVENFETRIQTKSGDEKIIWWNTQPLRDTSGKAVQFIAIGRDNTERRRDEERLRALRQFEESVIKNANIWISVLDGKGTVSIWNRAAEEISGYKAREVIGKNTIWSRIYPDKEYRHTVTAKIKEVIGAHKYLENFETRIRTKDGQERIIWWNTRVLQDIPGINETFIAIGKDVTEQKTLSDAVTLANKKLNLLASITRHDIKNQLMALLAYLELSGNGSSSPAQQAEYIKKAQQIAGTIERQIDLTKDYQEMGIAAPAWQNANECIRKAVAALPMRSVHVEVDPAKPEVYADPLFEKVFYNLIDNALRYGGADLKTIRVSSQESDSGLMITCEDDGVGISAEDKKKLFTRGFGKHTGLGLFLSREILGITGITITENGTPGKGARFEITVPKGAYRFTGAGAK